MERLQHSGGNPVDRQSRSENAGRASGIWPPRGIGVSNGRRFGCPARLMALMSAERLAGAGEEAAAMVENTGGLLSRTSSRRTGGCGPCFMLPVFFPIKGLHPPPSPRGGRAGRGEGDVRRTLAICPSRAKVLSGGTPSRRRRRLSRVLRAEAESSPCPSLFLAYCTASLQR